MQATIENTTAVTERPVAVITTIQSPTHSVRLLAERLEQCGGMLIVIGDKKGPAAFDMPNVEFHSLSQQLADSLALSKLLPVGHYARKNVGYLYAIQRGEFDCLYETDDDNAPAQNWAVRSQSLPTARRVAPTKARWVNAYRYFTGEHIWPRGFPLDEISIQPPATELLADVTAPVQQGLVDGAPDVDAIWRLVLGRDFNFEPGMPLVLGDGNWCPFNTQNTWWWPVAYPLLYVPSFCSFRMCDIWKSFVAQRCLWELDAGVAFLPADAIQERNVHSLMRDFADEVPGYNGNKRLVDVLAATKLTPGREAVGDNLARCYRALADAEFFPAKELQLVEAWLNDLATLTR